MAAESVKASSKVKKTICGISLTEIGSLNSSLQQKQFGGRHVLLFMHCTQAFGSALYWFLYLDEHRIINEAKIRQWNKHLRIIVYFETYPLWEKFTLTKSTQDLRIYIYLKRTKYRAIRPHKFPNHPPLNLNTEELSVLLSMTMKLTYTCHIVYYIFPPRLYHVYSTLNISHKKIEPNISLSYS